MIFKYFSFQLSKIYGLGQEKLRRIHCLRNNLLRTLFPEYAWNTKQCLLEYVSGDKNLT